MDDRKLKILAIVVDEYIKTGEPVGSKVISKHPDINVSSATVRNDMATLEQLGYLVQPHTSAGRVPTYSGFRLYIDKLMKVQELTAEERLQLDKSLEEQGALTEESIIQSATQTLAELTQCAVVVANSAPKFSVISKVEIIPTGKRLYVILLITSNGTIKNKACRLEFDLTSEQMDFFSKYIQENLQGEAIESLSDERMEELVTALGTYMMTLTPLVQGIYEMSRDLRRDEYTVQGERNLLACNDFDKMDILNIQSITENLEPRISSRVRLIPYKHVGDNNAGMILGIKADYLDVDNKKISNIILGVSNFNDEGYSAILNPRILY